MNRGNLLTALLVCCGHSVWAQSDNSLIDLVAFAREFGFPASELIVKDATADERAMNGTSIFSAVRVEAKTPFAFYPTVISVASEGIFVTEAAKTKFREFDSLPEGDVMIGGRGAFGSFRISDWASGGIYRAKVFVPADPASFDRPQSKVVTLSAVTIPKRNVDVRVVFLAPFSSGEELVKVPGGELYFQTFGDSPKDVEAENQPPSRTLDVRSMIIGINRIVLESRLVDHPSSGSPSSSEVQASGSKENGKSEKGDDKSRLVSSGSKTKPIFAWEAAASALLLLAFGFYCWRRK